MIGWLPRSRRLVESGSRLIGAKLTWRLIRESQEGTESRFIDAYREFISTALDYTLNGLVSLRLIDARWTLFTHRKWSLLAAAISGTMRFSGPRHLWLSSVDEDSFWVFGYIFS